MELIWKKCPRFPDHEVSNCGDLRRALRPDVSRNGQYIKGIIDPDGYIRYCIKHEGSSYNVSAHVLVAEAFIGEKPSPKHQVAHNNGSKKLNTPNNLRWATTLENQNDRLLHGTDTRGVGNGRATITEDDVRFIRKKYFDIKITRGDVSSLDKMFNLTRSQIIRIAKRQAWAHVSDE